MPRFRPEHEKFLRRPITWVAFILILFAAFSLLLSRFSPTDSIATFLLTIFFFPLGFYHWFNLSPKIPTLYFLVGAYYALVGFVIYKIKVSTHWMKFVIFLLLLLLATFIGCTQGGMPHITT